MVPGLQRGGIREDSSRETIPSRRKKKRKEKGGKECDICVISAPIPTKRFKVSDCAFVPLNARPLETEDGQEKNAGKALQRFKIITYKTREKSSTRRVSA